MRQQNCSNDTPELLQSQPRVACLTAPPGLQQSAGFPRLPAAAWQHGSQQAAVQCTVYTVKCTVHNVQCTVYSVQCTVHNVQCTVYSVQCTVYSVQCTLYSVLYTVHCTVCSRWKQLNSNRTYYETGLHYNVGNFNWHHISLACYAYITSYWFWYFIKDPLPNTVFTRKKKKKKEKNIILIKRDNIEKRITVITMKTYFQSCNVFF